MKIEVLKGTIGATAKGGIVDIDDKEAEGLIALGFAKKMGVMQEEKPTAPPTSERKALEEKAKELKLGAAKEIKAMSDEDLAKRVEEAEAAEAKRSEDIKAAEQRKAIEARALELKLGTADEIKALSDEELKSLVEKTGGNGGS